MTTLTEAFAALAAMLEHTPIHAKHYSDKGVHNHTLKYVPYYQQFMVTHHTENENHATAAFHDNLADAILAFTSNIEPWSQNPTREDTP